MARCKKCGKEQFLRKGLCYKCHKETERTEVKENPTQPVITHTMPPEVDINKLKEAKAKILVVDPIIADVIALPLKVIDCDVKIATDVESALEQLSPDLDMVFTEYNLYSKKMDCIGLIKKIKERYPFIPVAVITTYDSSIAKTVLEFGAFNYLRKPFQFDEIFRLVERGYELRHKGGGGSPK